MLEKTRAMLAAIPAGTHVADGVECFDEAEIAEFGSVLASLVYAPSKLRRRLQEIGVSITRSDFYSEIPTIAELERSFAQPSRLTLDRPFQETAFLRDFLASLIPVAAEFDPPVKPVRDGAYAWESGAFGYSDAMAYYCMIRRFRPKTIVELGCGASTLVASLACEQNGMGRIVAIEPFPAPWLASVPRVELIQARVQDLDASAVTGQLADGDLLFIDTTHTVKHDSDCLHIYLRILPQVAATILVHAHDIYLPGTLALHTMRDHQIFWNEQYLLYAYLVGNPRTRVLFGSAYHAQVNADLLTALMHGRYAAGGASLWFTQQGTAPPAIAPSAVAPSAVAPPAVAPPAIAPSPVAPPAVAPSAVAPPAVAPSAVAPPAMAPSAIAPPAPRPAASG